GNVQLTSKDLFISDSAVIDSQTNGGGTGGDIFIKADEFVVTSSGQLVTNTTASQKAGSITVEVDNGLILNGENTGLFAITSPFSTGNGGSIFIRSPLVSISENAGIGVSASGTGIGGLVDIGAKSLILSDAAFISAETDSGAGGNIDLNVSDIILSQAGSTITSRAGTAGGGGNGGNIKLNTGYLISRSDEENDILANAFSGTGGSIDINAQGIIGFAAVNSQTPFSDINASSELGLPGTVSINALVTDPSSELTEIPQEILDSSIINNQACARKSTFQSADISEFFITTSQREIELDRVPVQELTLSNWVTYRQDSQSQLAENRHQKEPGVYSSPAVNPAVPLEANGLNRRSDGQIALVAFDSGTTGPWAGASPATQLANQTTKRCSG
ncbi:MAG: hypothetical protein AAGB01_08065, partial [Cyanobacteria bacterium P01_F01_bin.42]